MSIEIYTSDFKKRDTLTDYSRVGESIYYNDIGTIQITAAATKDNLSILVNGSYAYNTETETIYVILSHKVDSKRGTVTISGKTADWLLTKRIVNDDVDVSNVRDLYAIVKNNIRGLNMSVSSSSPSARFEETAKSGEVLDAIEPILENAELGRRVLWDGSKLTFEIYRGTDRTTGIHSVVFSEEQGTALEVVYSDDLSNFKNVCGCWITYDDEEKEYHTVGNATGVNRYETTIPGITQESEEDYAGVEARAAQLCREELQDCIKRIGFQCNVDPSEIGVKYNVGDYVKCASMRLGIELNARITGIKLDSTPDGHEAELILGDPILTLSKEVKHGFKRFSHKWRHRAWR